MNADEVWKMEGVFSRNYSMFGLVSIVFFCGIVFVKYWSFSLYLLFTFAIFFTLEFKLNRLLKKAVNDARTVINRKSLFFESVLVLIHSIYFSLTIFNTIPEEICSKENISFLSTYTKASIFSLILFMFFLSFKEMCIALNIFKVFDIKRGVLGVCYRILVIIRTLLVTKSWTLYFSQRKDVNVIEELLHGKFNRALFYLGAKGFFLTILIWDLDNARRNVTFFVTKLYKKGRLNYTCHFCKRENCPIVYLPCEHCMCEQCAINLLKASPFCPVCKEPPSIDPLFSYSYGCASLSSIFCCF